MPLTKKSIRYTVIGLGALFITIPLVAYMDARLGWLGEPREGVGNLDLMWAVLIIIGAILLVSGIVGQLLTWPGVVPLSMPSVEGAVSVKSDKIPPTAAASPRKPPFEGDFVRVDPLTADSNFVKAGAEYFRTKLHERGPFAEAVKGVYRSRTGRPNWVFDVETSDGGRHWIYMPHGGRSGAGASQNSARSERD
jgi:hypothetical protein